MTGRPGTRRLVLGGLFGVIILVITIARVDLVSAATIVAGATLSSLAVAFGIVLLDLAIRALRWQILLRGVGSDTGGPLRLVLAYLSIGYLANLLLPARLGDLARAVLSGSPFRMSRLSALGTIMVERVADGGTMTMLAVASSIVIGGAAVVRTLALEVTALLAIGVVALAILWWVATKTTFGATTVGRLTRDIGGRLAAGLGATRKPGGVASLAILTVAAAATAILVAWFVAASVGILLTPPEAALFVSAIALSLAIPGAPGSIGTYEFAGVLVLTSLGYPPDRAFAAVVLLRLTATLPPVALGVVSAWSLHLRPGAIVKPESGLSREREGEGVVS